jgi:hypothetical protein
MLRPNFGSLVNGIIRSKTIDLLLDSASLTEIAPTEPAEATKSGDA